MYVMFFIYTKGIRIKVGIKKEGIKKNVLNNKLYNW